MGKPYVSIISTVECYYKFVATSLLSGSAFGILLVSGQKVNIRACLVDLLH